MYNAPECAALATLRQLYAHSQKQKKPGEPGFFLHGHRPDQFTLTKRQSMRLSARCVTSMFFFIAQGMIWL